MLPLLTLFEEYPCTERAPSMQSKIHPTRRDQEPLRIENEPPKWLNQLSMEPFDSIHL
jgi:hypothetical protein